MQKKHIENTSRAKLPGRSLFCLILCLVVSSMSNAELLTEGLEEVVVTATRTETSLVDAPSNISVLTANQLATTAPVHIQQALSQVPGVSLQRGNGQESLPGIRSAVLTGAGACGNVLVMEEAIPVRGPSFCNVNELFDTHFEQASQIEVTRGPGTAFFGSNGLTGSINVRLPNDGPDELSLELGANQYTRAKAAFDSLIGRLFVSLTDDGGYRDDAGYQQQKVSWRHRDGFGAWSMDAGLTATRLDQQTAGFIIGADSYRNRELAQQNLDPEAFRKTNSVRAWARFSRRLSDKQTLQVTPFARSTDMDFRLHFLPGDPLEQNSQQGGGFQSSLVTDVTESFRFTVGVDGDISSGTLRQTQDNPTQGSTFLQETIPTGTHYDYQVDAKQIGLFGHSEWEINDQWDVIGGVRLERLAYDYNNLTVDGRTRDDGSECGFGGCRYSRPAGRKDRFSNVSPKIELRFQANQNLRLYASASQSFRAPQASELYRLQRAQTVAELDNVEATSLEIGASYSTASLQFRSSLYDMTQRNVIIRDSDFFNVDGTRVDSLGLEISLRHTMSEEWGWRLIGSIAEHQYASDQFSGEININGNIVDTAPQTSGSVFLDWQPSNKLSAELQWQHVDAYFLDPENLREYPGHTLLNIRGRYQFDDRWAASVRITNLSDRDYAERADYTSFTQERYFPGQPRSVYATLEYKFN